MMPRRLEPYYEYRHLPHLMQQLRELHPHGVMWNEISMACDVYNARSVERRAASRQSATKMRERKRKGTVLAINGGNEIGAEYP